MNPVDREGRSGALRLVVTALAAVVGAVVAAVQVARRLRRSTLPAGPGRG